jgi:hypothetical protein
MRNLETRIAKLEKQITPATPNCAQVWYCGTEADAEALKVSGEIEPRHGPVIVFVGLPGLNGFVQAS